jgi:hypothetical protein
MYDKYYINIISEVDIFFTFVAIHIHTSLLCTREMFVLYNRFDSTKQDECSKRDGRELGKELCICYGITESYLKAY